MSSTDYVEQKFPKRYITAPFLEEFVMTKIDEFGAQWSAEIGRDGDIIFRAKRKMTTQEIQNLQEKSYEARAPRDPFE